MKREIATVTPTFNGDINTYIVVVPSGASWYTPGTIPRFPVPVGNNFLGVRQ